MSAAAPNTAIALESLFAARRTKPWKYVGYQGFSRFIASDDDFLFFRRFGDLSVRVLLVLQDEIVRLEAQLDALNESLSEDTAPDGHNGSFRTEPSQDRNEILHKVISKLQV